MEGRAAGGCWAAGWRFWGRARGCGPRRLAAALEHPFLLTHRHPPYPARLPSRLPPSYAERAYKSVPPLAEDEVYFHFRQMARTMHKNSDEYAAQTEYDKNFRETVQEARREKQEAAQAEGKTLSQAELEEDDTQRNQFNFTERAAQTYNPTTKVRTISTTPPDSSSSTGLMTQWGLYDAYVQEYERLLALVNMEKSVKEAKARAAAGSGEGGSKRSTGDPMHTPEMAARMRVMERIVSQVRAGAEGSSQSGRASRGCCCGACATRAPRLPASPLLHPPPHPPPSPPHPPERRGRDLRRL